MTTKTSPVRFGVIGCGAIAFWFHLRELRRLRNTELVAVADPDAGARDRASRLTGVPVYERPEELIDRADIDGVVISAPPDYHADLAVAAAAARKHIYIEKPIATTAEDAARIAAAVRESGVTAAVGFNRRFHPLFEQARLLLAEGRIGAVRSVQTVFSEPVAPDQMPAWKRRRSTGGGVLLDLASHHADLLRWFLNDEVADVDARLISAATEDDSAWMSLTMRGGARAQSFFSFRSGLADFFEFFGERGTLRVDRHQTSLSLGLARRYGYGVRNAFVLPSRDTLSWRLTRLLRPSCEPSYRRALAAFADTIRGRPHRGATLDDGVRSLEVILRAEESARTRRPAAVGSGTA